jgi:hypothetical protein
MQDGPLPLEINVDLACTCSAVQHQDHESMPSETLHNNNLFLSGTCFRLFEGELYNGRLAMLAVPGVLAVEAIGKGPWWQAPFTVRPMPSQALHAGL